MTPAALVQSGGVWDVVAEGQSLACTNIGAEGGAMGLPHSDSTIPDEEPASLATPVAPESKSRQSQNGSPYDSPVELGNTQTSSVGQAFGRQLAESVAVCESSAPHACGLRTSETAAPRRPRKARVRELVTSSSRPSRGKQCLGGGIDERALVGSDEQRTDCGFLNSEAPAGSMSRNMAIEHRAVSSGPPQSVEISEDPAKLATSVASEAQSRLAHSCAPYVELSKTSQQPLNDPKGIKILSWNLNGARARLKRSDLLSVMKEANADIFCAQEFRCPLEVFLKRPGVGDTLRKMGYFYIAYHMSVENAGYAGVAIFSRVRFTGYGEGVGDDALDTEGRLAWVDFAQFRLYNVYAPNSGSIGNLSSLPKKLKFMKALSERVKWGDKPALLCGDFNVTRLHSDVYDGLSHPRWANHPSCTPEERNAFERILSESKLVDVQEVSRVKGFTYFARAWEAHHNLGMRLDYSLCTEKFFTDHVLDFKLLPTTSGSDHVPSMLTLNSDAFTAVELGLEPPPLVRLGAPDRTFRLDQVLETPSTYSVEGRTIQDAHVFSMREHLSHLVSPSDDQPFVERHQVPEHNSKAAHTLDPDGSGSVRWQDMIELFNGFLAQ